MSFFKRKPDHDADIIAILGMHRSGTSCLAGSLQNKGLFLGQVHEWNEHNLKGNREHEQIAELNEELLIHNGGSWHQPPQKLKWRRKHVKQRDVLIRQFADSKMLSWGFKDTRAVFTLEFWRDALPQITTIATYRHPLLVARSLLKRDNMPMDYAFDLWCTYNNKILERHGEAAFPIISFDADSQHYQHVIDAWATKMNLPKPGGAPFRDDILKADIADQENAEIPDKAMVIYQQLEQLQLK